jgi:hypothetical protein
MTTSLSINNSSQYKIDEVVLVTKTGRIDVSQIFTEINIFDSVMMPVMSGNIMIRDSLNLSGQLFFDGSEALLISIKKDSKSEIGSFKKAFRIYKQTNRVADGPATVKYLLHFVSDELIFSDQQRINQSYEKTYSNIVKDILTDYLLVPSNNLGGLYENSFGIKSVVIPNLRPLEAIQWCAKRAVDYNNSANFLFFQNITGYNFASLSTLLSQPEILDIQFRTKNLEGENSISEMQGARYLEVLSLNDAIDKTRSGVNAGKFIGFDPITRTILTKNISYGDHYLSMEHGNKTPNFSSIQNRAGVENSQAFNSKKALTVFGYSKQFSEYIKKKDPTSIVKEETQEFWFFQRKAILKNLMSKKLKIVMPGNFQLSSGFNVNVDAPQIGVFNKKTNEGDKSINGKYLIIASRQIISFEKHETIIEVASDSSTLDFIPESNRQQQAEILNYGTV